MATVWNIFAAFVTVPIKPLHSIDNRVFALPPVLAPPTKFNFKSPAGIRSPDRGKFPPKFATTTPP